ncbi:MAG: acetyl-CoA acetyltransferase, partial [Pseudomonadota bacterium]
MRPGEEQTTASSMADSRPILVGVGQSISRWKGGEVGDAPSPLSLSIQAVHKAFEDTGARDAIAGRVDTLVAVRTLEDSVPKSPYPFGRCENYPGAVADAMELKPSTAIYSAVGGDQPQALVNEFASKLASGESRCVLLCGAEATAAYKAAVRSEQVLDWSSQSSLPTEDRGIGVPLSTREERKNGLGWPTNSYPLFEEAYRARKKLTRAEYLVEISELFAGFSEVASENPYAQYPSKRSGEYLGTRSAGNYPIAGPYLKWHVAQDAVNQGAALLLTTVSEARSAGIPEEKWVYLHGHSTLSDCHITERPDYSRSRSLEGTLAQALE